MRRAALVFVPLLLVAVPDAEAAHVRSELRPALNTLVLEPGGAADLSYSWRVWLEDTSCEDGTEFGLDFVPEYEAWWVGMSFDPLGEVVRFDAASGGSVEGTTTLEVRLDSGGPRSGEVPAELHPELNLLYAYRCTPQPTEDANPARLALRVEPSATPTSPSPTPNGGESPAPGLLLMLLAVLGAARRRR